MSEKVIPFRIISFRQKVVENGWLENVIPAIELEIETHGN